ncbi:MAG TPA: TetR/AcrR family transcriptional regulator [Polyangiales bacterium]|nr:TetR/AcrR family transcriptional regulator [Polyangiales bacterium]
MEAILTAVAEELGRVGYANLRIEDVATRSGVNKTTIYRRWPQKSELVVAAVERLAPKPEVYDTGSLRGDLTAMLSDLRSRIMDTPAGRGIARMMQAERAHPEVAGVLRRMRATHVAARRAPFERAIARGEIPAASNVEMISEIAVAPLINRMVHHVEEVDDVFLRGIVEVLVKGAVAGGAVT